MIARMYPLFSRLADRASLFCHHIPLAEYITPRVTRGKSLSHLSLNIVCLYLSPLATPKHSKSSFSMRFFSTIADAGLLRCLTIWLRGEGRMQWRSRWISNSLIFSLNGVGFIVSHDC